MDAPSGYCLKLNKSIYGLKQAPRVWYGKLKSFFASAEFGPSPADPCLFISTKKAWECFVHVYVDDLIIFGHDVDRFKGLIAKRYLMEDLGEATHLLGIHLSRNGGVMTLSQDAYLGRILSKYNMSDCRPVSTPMVPNTRLTASTREDHKYFSLRKINYSQAIGLLNYLAVSTRPDISFTLSKLSQHLKLPNESHWSAVIHLLRYLSGTRGFTLTLTGCSDASLRIFTNSDSGNCPDTRRSYSGYVALLGDSVMSWRSKKQETVSTSTTEAEYKAVYKGLQEAVWLVALLKSLGHAAPACPSLLVNNQGALMLSLNPMYQSRSKHIDVKFHWIREVLEEGAITISYTSTNSNLADLFTKALPWVKHSKGCTALSLVT